MLFMGDAGLISYNTLKNQLPKEVSILKLGHHGAKGTIDKNMLQELNPQYVLISNAHNDYKHPHVLTLNVLRKTKVLRTDINNSIKVSVGKKVIKYTTSTKNSNHIVNCKNNTNPFNTVGFTLLRIVKVLLSKAYSLLRKM